MELVLIGEWSAPGPDAQRRAAEAALNAWRAHPWPDGLLAHHCLLGEDGRAVVHHLRWADEAAARAFAGTGKPGWARTVDAAAPGITRHRVTAYRQYRTTTPLTAAPPAGCLVTVTVDLDAPDPDFAIVTP